MKQVLILASIVLLFFSCKTANNTMTTHKSTVNENYKSLKTFNGDTTSYYKYNFIENKDKYIGKDITALLNDLEIAIQSAIPGQGGGYEKANDIRFSNVSRKESTKRFNFPGSGNAYFLSVGFDPVPYDPLHKYLREHNNEVTKDMYPYFSQFIIKDIWFNKYE